MSKRIYLVGKAPKQRLVRAYTSVGARNHAAKDEIPVSVANQETLISLITSGVKVEDAGTEQLEIPMDGPPHCEASPGPPRPVVEAPTNTILEFGGVPSDG